MAKPMIVGQPLASQHLRSGLNTVADLLAPTLGPTSGRVMQQSGTNRPEVLDDSATIVRRLICLDNRSKNVGAMLMRNLVWRVGQQVGDGGVLTAVLTRAIFNDALRVQRAGVNPIDLSRGVEKAVAAVVAALRAQARPLVTEDEFASVALAATADRPLATLLGELSYLLGPDGYVHIENSAGPNLERRYITGARFSAQSASTYLCTDSVRQRAVVTNPLVALVDEPVTEIDQIVRLLEGALQIGSQALVIIAPAFSEAALGVLVANQKSPQNRLSLVAAKLTAGGDERFSTLADLALLTGATILGTNYERSVARSRVDDFGRARRVEVSRDELAVVTDKNVSAAIRDKVTELRNTLAALPLDDEQRPILLKRLSTLTQGVGELRVGATNHHERDLRRSSAERALRTLSAAHRGGVVAGGGAAFCHCRPMLEGIQAEGDVALGVAVVIRALSAPFLQILRNAHVDAPAVMVQHISDAGPPATYDVRSRQIVDAHQAGILDVTDVLITAIRVAASGAMMASSTDTVVYRREPEVSLEP